MSDDSVINTVDSDKLIEVVQYIEKMKDFDRSNFIKLQEINDLVWGLLFFIAGVIDYLFSLTNRPELTVFPWFLMSAGGMSLSLYINTRKSKDVLTEEVEEFSNKMRQMYRVVIMLTLLSWIGMTAIVTIFDLVWLILPTVSFLVGSTIFLANSPRWSRAKLRKFYKPSNRLVFLPFMCYSATIINIIGYLIDPAFQSYMGITLGVLLGFGFGSGGFVGRR